MKHKQTVFVGLSGGVDSSVAALRLKKQGYNVVGVFIKVWQPDFLDCNWEQERLDAMRVAAHLDIPFLTCDAEEAYRTEVGEFFVSEYLAGRTPNPDVMCNQHVKFGAFLDFAKSKGADFVATGHYAQKEQIDDQYQLKRGVDTNKDQSYFLWTLTQKQLAHVLLPVGDTTKNKIRQEAEAANIPVATKKDSQGICFLGQVDIREFLSHFTKLIEGRVQNEQGETIGTHHGALIYTIGQRHGFTIDNQDSTRSALFVTARDLSTNTITVSSKKPVAVESATLKLTSCNWIVDTPSEATKLLAQFRYRQTPFVVMLKDITAKSGLLIIGEATDAVAAGQSCVLYDGGTCLGGGIIAQ